MQTLECPYCKTPINPAEDINPIRKMAKCSNCGVQFQLDQIAQKKYRKRELLDTSKVAITKEDGNLTIEFPWKSSPFLIIFATIWNVVMVIMIAAMMTSGFNILMLTHPTVGVVVGYLAVCGIWNKTKISLTTDLIEISCGPFPWPNVKKTIRRDLIEQLYVQLYLSHRKNGAPIHKYKLVVQTTNNTFCLADGIAEYEQAISIEVALEDAMGIQDLSMPDEHQE